MDPGIETAGSDDIAFEQRARLHLGTELGLVGNLHNWNRVWSHEVDLTAQSTTFTRVLCLNVGGGRGTLRDPEKLSFLTFALIQQGIHVACLTESGIKRNDLTAALRRVGMEREFRAFGQNGKISWLVREPVADKVVAKLDYEGGRISGLVLAGACKQRTFFFGVYGHAGASTDNQLARRQADLWSRLEGLAKPNQERGHHVIVLGDFNVLPSATFTTSQRALKSSIEDLLVWQSALGLSNVLLQGFPEASLRQGFFTRSHRSQRGAELSLLDHIMAPASLS